MVGMAQVPVAGFPSERKGDIFCDGVAESPLPKGTPVAEDSRSCVSQTWVMGVPEREMEVTGTPVSALDVEDQMDEIKAPEVKSEPIPAALKKHDNVLMLDSLELCLNFNSETEDDDKEARKCLMEEAKKYSGISLFQRTGKWEAHLWERRSEKSKKGKQWYLGTFASSRLAAMARDIVMLFLRKKTAKLNFDAEIYKSVMPYFLNHPVLKELLRLGEKKQLFRRLRLVLKRFFEVTGPYLSKLADGSKKN